VIRGSDVHNRNLFLVCLFILFAIFIPCSYAFTHSLSPFPHLTNREERKLGKKFFEYIKRHVTIIDDPRIVNYVNRVGQKIVSQLPVQPFEYRFYVIKKHTYNAFATPAGYIFINSGLIADMDSEEELAGILAHEIAHVACRHISKRIEKNKKIGLATMAGLLAGIFLGGSAATSAAVATSSIAAGKSLALKYSREDEIQADQIGLKYLTRAGYSGKGMLTVLKKIRSNRWFGPEQTPTYLTTHPAIEDRLTYIDTWLQVHPEKTKSSISFDPDDFQKVKTRIIALYGDVDSALRTFCAAIKKDPRDGLAYYGLGLTLFKNNQKEEALRNFQTAVRYRATDPDILRELGKTYFYMGRYSEALRTLHAAIAFNPNDCEVLFLLGRAQLEVKNLKNARESFQTLLKKHPDYVMAIYYLGETFSRLGNQGEAHYYLGLYFKKKGRYRNALFHLNRAMKHLGTDPKKKEMITKALKDLYDDQKRGRSGKSAL